MIKRLRESIFYWEVWKDGRVLTIHYGVVGETGETEEKKLSLFQNGDKIMAELAQEKESEGFSYLDEDGLFELVVQYRYRDNEMETMLEKRHATEELLNECLGWSGNGHSDGGDIGSCTANIYNYVVDVEKAKNTIIEELQKHNLLEDVKMAYSLSEDDDEYIALYPEGTRFEIM